MKSILVTGACGGMGRAACQHFKSLGYSVFALDLRECEAEEGIIPIVADVTSEESIQKAFSVVKEQRKPQKGLGQSPGALQQCIDTVFKFFHAETRPFIGITIIVTSFSYFSMLFSLYIGIIQCYY